MDHRLFLILALSWIQQSISQYDYGEYGGSCRGGDPLCCSNYAKCLEGEGTCTADDACEGELICKKGACDWNKYKDFKKDDRCCAKPATTCNGPSKGQGIGTTKKYTMQWTKTPEECRCLCGEQMDPPCHSWVWQQKMSKEWWHQTGQAQVGECLMVFTQGAKGVPDPNTVSGTCTPGPDPIDDPKTCPVVPILPPNPPTIVCPVDPRAWIWHQWEIMGPRKRWTFELGIIKEAPNPCKLPNGNKVPRGHITSIKLRSKITKLPDTWLIFYPDTRSYRCSSSTSLPCGGGTSATTTLEPGKGLVLPPNWIINNVFQTGEKFLVAFIHVDMTIKRSIAIAYSQDNGITWIKIGEILKLGPPKDGKNEGIGNFDVVWDWQQHRWFLVAEQLTVAVSSKIDAHIDSWKWWTGTKFDGKVGVTQCFTDLKKRKLPSGKNPSIHWNRFIHQWIMTWEGYDGEVYVTSNTQLRLTGWAYPRCLVKKNERKSQHNCYPTLVTENLGDKLGGHAMFLYWREYSSKHPNGVFLHRKVTLKQ